MASKTFIYALASRLPALLFLFAIVFSPDILSVKSQHVATSILNTQEDPTDIAAVLDLPESSWQTSTVSRKYIPTDAWHTHWYRLEVDSLPSNNDDWLVTMEGTGIMDLSKVEFFLVSGQQVLSRFNTGGDYPETFSSQQDFRYLFKFRVEKPDTRIYIRTASNGDLINTPQIYSERDYKDHARSLVFIVSILNGCLLGLAIYSLGLFVVLRDVTYFYLGFWQICSVFMAIYVSRFIKTIAPMIAIKSEQLYPVGAVFFGGFFVFLFLFAGKYFDYRRNFPKSVLYLKIHLYASVMSTVTFAFAKPSWIIVQLGFLIVSAIVRNMFVYSGHLKQSFVFLFSTAASFYIVGGIAFVLSDVGIIEWTQFRYFSLHIGSIFGSAILSVSMSQRLKFMEKRHKDIVNAIKKDDELVKLNALLNESFSGHFNTSDLDVSMMFVDIASFSEISLGRTQSDIYRDLSALITSVVGIVEEHGGSIDRSVGAGVLCLFGYKKVGKSFDPSVDAFSAACRIQEMNVQRSLGSVNKIIMPMRIGIHTAKVTIGNLGDQGRIDFTVIGAGVNLASRLKESCSPYKVILSQAVRDQLKAGGRDVERLSPISIAVKHQAKLLEAFEFNPFGAAPELLQRVESVFLEHIGMRSLDQRFRLKNDAQINLVSDVGVFQVRDFSNYGFRAVSTKLLGRQTVINVKIQTSNPHIDAQLSEALLSDVALEVRWSRQTEHGFEHGFKIYGGGSRQSEFIFNTFKIGFAGDAISQTLDQIVTEVAS